MFAIHLAGIYESLRSLGLARSQRHYSRVWLGRGPNYLRDITNRDRGWRRLSPPTAARLRANLAAVSAMVPAGVAAEIKIVLRTIDRDTEVAIKMMGGGR